MTGLPHRLTHGLRPSRPPHTTASAAVRFGKCLALFGFMSAFVSPTTYATPTHDIRLSAQRASYELTLAESSGGTTLSASGHMTYSVHDTCTAWATQQHLDIQSVTRNGGETHLVSDYTTLESKDGRHLAFRTVQKSNNAILQAVSGEATLTPNGGEVHYEKPLRKTLKLPAGTLFPMAHTAAILGAAESGKTEISPLLFDGTAADGAQYTYISTYGWEATPPAPPFALLARLPTTRVHVAFFNTTPDSMMPDYEMGMRYFANGVSDKLDMDFGDFRMSGTLQHLSIPQAPKKC